MESAEWRRHTEIDNSDFPVLPRADPDFRHKAIKATKIPDRDEQIIE